MTAQQSTVHMVFKTHLDVGFTDYAQRVVERYFHSFIPNAISLARALRDHDNVGFVWTTGSWLIYEYLEQAGTAERRLMEDAIAAGEIAWHGLPFTTHTELMDVSLARYGLSLARILDERFGKKTIAAKMTDVPGHTRGLVPLLAEAGITFLHIGINPASAVPEVPPVFVWRDEASASDVIVMVDEDYGSTRTIPGLDDAISIILTGDNIGPQSPDDVYAAFAAMQERFPGAHVVASTMDAFAARLPAVKANLPVVTQEIGDTWIHGVGTDPGKVAGFRQLCRLRRRWIETGKAVQDSPDLARFSRNLLLVSEHTWGLDEKSHLLEHETYNPEDFRKARKRVDFRRFEASWAEQRHYLTDAIAALTDMKLRSEAAAQLDALIPMRFQLEGAEVCTPDVVYETAHFTMRFDQQGALSELTSLDTGYQWANPLKRLGGLVYQSFSHEDYELFWDQYIRNKGNPEVTVWAIEDYTKPGLENARACSQEWVPSLQSLQRRKDADGVHFLAHMAMPALAAEDYGCPREIMLKVFLPVASPQIHFDLRWFGKAPNRMPEALWYSFDPIVEEPDRWLMEKLGKWISPLDVVSRGARSLHAVGQGVMYPGDSQQLYIDTVDAPLVAPGRRALLRFENIQPPLAGGMHFNLYNNVWGTNFPMWYKDDARFRFKLRVESMSE